MVYEKIFGDCPLSREVLSSLSDGNN